MSMKLLIIHLFFQPGIFTAGLFSVLKWLTGFTYIYKLAERRRGGPEGSFFNNYSIPFNAEG